MIESASFSNEARAVSRQAALPWMSDKIRKVIITELYYIFGKMKVSLLKFLPLI